MRALAGVIGARLTSHRIHKLVANPMRGLSNDAHEPWKTFYRLNSRRTLSVLGKATGFADVELRMIEAQPSYLIFSVPTFLAGVAYERFVNRFNSLEWLRANIIGKMIK